MTVEELLKSFERVAKFHDHFVGAPRPSHFKMKIILDYFDELEKWLHDAKSVFRQTGDTSLRDLVRKLETSRSQHIRAAELYVELLRRGH